MLSFGDFTATKPNEVHLIWEQGQQSTQPNKLTGELSHEYLFSKYMGEKEQFLPLGESFY